MTMQQRITQQLAPLAGRFLEVHDESHMHSRGQETHYKAIIVDDQFEGLNRVKRHQLVYATMGELMQQIHALAIHTYTADEWAAIGAAPTSPVCAGGGH